MESNELRDSGFLSVLRAGWVWLEPRRSRWLGALLGLIAAILLLTLGFWRTLLIVLCVGTGWFLGGHQTRGLLLALYTRWRDRQEN